MVSEEESGCQYEQSLGKDPESREIIVLKNQVVHPNWNSYIPSVRAEGRHMRVGVGRR